jgi:multidrug transporter EmrE-like cation transporter
MNKLSQSIQKNKYGMLIMVFSAVCTSFGQYFWKLSSGSNLWLMFIGFAFYGIGALLMITAFKFGSFSVIHPMLSLGYIFAMLIGFFFLNETINPPKIAGLLFILFGVIMIGVGDE